MRISASLRVISPLRASSNTMSLAEVSCNVLIPLVSVVVLVVDSDGKPAVELVPALLLTILVASDVAVLSVARLLVVSTG